MTQTLVVVYLSRLPRPGPAEHFSPLATKCSTAQAASNWPYDVGDDPSFFSAKSSEGPVTWGVCRQDVRNQLRPGDLVVFFAAIHRYSHGHTDYVISAAFTVQTTIALDEIFRTSAHEQLRDYLNLLSRPNGSGWEHFEPALPRNEWHSDWMWRVCHHKGYKKNVLVNAGLHHRPGDTLTVAGHKLTFALNYILFSCDPAQSVVFAQPTKVAHWTDGDQLESWLDTPFARVVRSSTLGPATGRSLRTRNRQQPHRHIWASSGLHAKECVSRLRAAGALDKC